MIITHYTFVVVENEIKFYLLLFEEKIENIILSFSWRIYLATSLIPLAVHSDIITFFVICIKYSKNINFIEYSPSLLNLLK
ncbi:hypothetical protein MCY_00382 [Bartonella rattimassiliensis 15908]|uniref:Uncharacterized protein n=1 Tax=Bartonella rattimassiliensis 15908 TaxID=1094556 RepID=J0ZGK9_9HYPH|nr:hypothetical protein MCY_00382 [Bartonella rattimassiliensis 15908]